VQVAFVCPACWGTINAPPSLEGESYPCPKCKADVDRWPAPVSSPGVVRVVPQPPPVEKAVWHYSVNGARRGPVTTAQLKSLVESAVLRATDLVWREGMPAWVEAGTIPELFPAGALPAPAPVPVPPPSQGNERDDEDRQSRRDDRHAVQVHVHQVVEQDEDRQPRRSRPRFRCPYCGSTERPFVRQQVSGAGWAVFVILLIFTIILCFIGLFIKEDVWYCRDCGRRV
jgi:hypothetical protein